ncbi:hypothetical protein M1413_01260 [Patescibacteria group bacterium]|nr:hypothetical protein [Patescibacteria group bacterium]MCL5114274.1 hypothetical protein [Patescibacteria group bacterium]
MLSLDVLLEILIVIAALLAVIGIISFFVPRKVRVIMEQAPAPNPGPLPVTPHQSWRRFVGRLRGVAQRCIMWLRSVRAKIRLRPRHFFGLLLLAVGVVVVVWFVRSLVVESPAVYWWSLGMFVIVAVVAKVFPKYNNWLWVLWFGLTIFCLVETIIQWVGFLTVGVVDPQAHLPLFWFWVAIQLFVEWILLVPFVFWDEVNEAYQTAKRALDQRIVVFKQTVSEPQQVTVNTPVAGATASAGASRPSPFQGILKWTERMLPAELIAEFAVELMPRIWKRIGG